jgi:hypothetical protein
MQRGILPIEWSNFNRGGPIGLVGNKSICALAVKGRRIEFFVIDTAASH